MYLCAGPGQGSNFCLKNSAIVSLPTLCIHLGVLLVDLNLSLFTKGNYCCTASHLPLGVTNEERDANLSRIKKLLAPSPGTQRRYRYASPDNSQLLAPLSDSCIQNRGVANYLLSLLFSLVSLLFSFYFCVLNQKYQEYLLPFLCG